MMRARDCLPRVLAALQGLGGSATLAQVARRADLERPTAHRALSSLQKERRVEAEPWGTRALRERADSADRVWHLACDHVATCDGCGAPASWRGEVEGVVCDLCERCHRAGVVP